MLLFIELNENKLRLIGKFGSLPLLPYLKSQSECFKFNVQLLRLAILILRKSNSINFLDHAYHNNQTTENAFTKTYSKIFVAVTVHLLVEKIKLSIICICSRPTCVLETS